MNIKLLFWVLLLCLSTSSSNSILAKDEKTDSIPRIHLREDGKIYLGPGDRDATVSPLDVLRYLEKMKVQKEDTVAITVSYNADREILKKLEKALRDSGYSKIINVIK